MKKIISLLLVVLVLFLCTACGGDETSEGSVTTNDQNKNNYTETDNSDGTSKQPVNDITMDDVMNHPESPASDFLCNDDGNGGLVLLQYNGDDDIVVIPETIDGKGVTKINKFVFANSSPVVGIKFSSTINEIDEGAFINNTKLQYVICGNGLETIGTSAFFGCSALREVKLNNNLKTIGKQSFSGCSSLKSIDIPASVETIEIIAFNMMADDFKIIGEAGSVAETYANSSSITFEAK